ncbi:MAG: NAD(P)/FAD-dependent oxidoreductase [Phycisphaerae bacterium]
MSDPNRTADVLVLGGGVIGCASALRLAQAGLSVTLIERGACGRESSWAGAGILDEGSLARRDPLALLRRASVARWPDFAAEVQERSGCDVGYVRCGALDLIHDDNQHAAALRESGLAIEAPRIDDQPRAEMLTAAQVAVREPLVTRELRGALLKRSMAQVRNPRLMRGLRIACARVGVRMVEHTPVGALWVEPATLADADAHAFHGRPAVRVCGVETAGGRYAAPHTVLAAGAWSSQIAAELNAVMPVYPVRGQIALLELGAPAFRHILYSGRTYLVCRDDGRILTGSSEEHDSGFDRRNTTYAVESILRAAQRVVPALRDATLLQTWAGLRPGTPDRLPWLGPVPGLAGLFAATGHFRSGLTLAPITAALVTQWITGTATELDCGPFRPGRALRRVEGEGEDGLW